MRKLGKGIPKRRSNIGKLIIENDSIEVFQASDEFYAELQEVAKPFEAAWIKRVNAMGVDGLAALDFYKNEISKLTY